MDNADKEEVWRFWRTVSAAVKIAVNGRGNIVQTPKSQLKLSSQETDLKRKRHYLQELDQNAISIYVPVKPSKMGMIKYRVLKFANKKKVADYVEEVQHLESGCIDMNKRITLEDACSDEDINLKNKDNVLEGLQSSILSLITDTVKDDVQDNLKSVARYFEDASSRQTSKPLEARDTGETVDKSCEPLEARDTGETVDKSCKSFPPKKIWPVGRPTTRSFSSFSKKWSNSNAIKNASTLSKCSSKTSANFQENLENSNQSDLNILSLGQKFENNLNTFQTRNSVLQSNHDKIYSNLNNNKSNIQTKENQEGLSLVSVGTSGHTVSASFEHYVSSGSECSQEKEFDCNIKSHSSTISSSPSFSEQQNPPGQPRTASDIETIISALEEELKKSRANLTNVSVSSHVRPWPQSSANKINHAFQTTSTVEKEILHHQRLANADSTEVPNVPATDLDDSQSETSYMTPQDSVQHQVEPADALSHIKEPMHYTSSHSTNCGGGEPIQTSSFQTSPMKVAAYTDDLGQSVPCNVGHVSSMLNVSGQQVQVVHGQDIVEVDGSIDNITWACDGEVQIMQQLHQNEESIQVDETVPHNQEIEADQSLSETTPVQAHYDVVEYEVLSDKRLKRGRKKKGTTEGEHAGIDNETENSEVLERTCPICQRVLNYASSMKAHMRIHTGARPYSCGQCDRKFTTKANRDRHEATHVGLKPFKCQECHKSFTEKRSLKIHMRSHTGERPYVCEICGQGFAQNCTLQVHKVRHTDRRAHLCDLCGKAFRQKNQLEIHVKRHKRQAAFPCEHCEIRCYTKGDLMRHMVKHTGERPYVCHLCPRAFTRKQYLIDHENQHYNRKPYSCSECGMSFHDMGSCHRHLRKHKNSKEGNKEVSNSRIPHKLPLINVEVVQKMISAAKPGQVLKLEDGSDALVKNVTNDTDGSTVYHITCLNLVNNAAALTHYQHLPQGIQLGNSQHFVDVDSLALSQGAVIKVEDTENTCVNTTEQHFKDGVLSDLSKVEDFDMVDIENQEAVCMKR